GKTTLTTISSLHDLDRPFPASLVEEMNDDVAEKSHPLSEFPLLILVLARLERPVDKHRAANDILSRNESPISAVKTQVSIVAHSKVAVRGHDKIAVFNVVGHGQFPFRDHIALVAGRDGGKIITIRIVRVGRSLITVNDIRLVRLLA